ncbi:retrovirus-related pol polyprotein from transposon TNT 1-94 [Tanacetum coccineum]
MGDIIAQTRSKNVSKLSNDPLLARGNTLRSGEDSLKLQELMALCITLQSRVLNLETTKTTQANEIASLKRRVKNLEKKNKSRTHKLKRLYKVGLSVRVESSGDEENLGEDASKQGKRITDIDDDEDITLTILLALPEYIYAAVDSCETAQEIWFTSTDGESIESYYHRFSKLMNDFKRNKHFPEKIASNLKFLRNLQPEWSRHVTIVHQTKDLHIADYTQLYDFLKYNQKEVDDLRAERLAKTHDPLALIANSNNPFNYPVFHQDQPSPNRQMQMVGGNGGNQFRQYTGQNVMNQNGYNTVQNVGNQVVQNAVQNPGVQNVRNQNGLIVVPGIANQNPNGNGNVVASRAEGNVIGNNGNQIRCYNCRGLGHLARNYTVRPRRMDVAYLQTQLLIAQKEEAGIQLQAEEFDLMQESTSGTQTDKAPVYDLDGSAEVHHYENCYNNDIFNMFTQEEQYTELLEPIPEPHQIQQNDSNVISEVSSMEQSGGTVDQHPATFEETRIFRINPFKPPREDKYVPNKVRASVMINPIIVSQPYVITKKDVNSDSNGLSSKELGQSAKPFLGTDRFGNDHVAAILGFGDLQSGNILITRVYFIEGLGHNLFSVGQFCDSDLEVTFRRNTCFIRNLEGVDLLKGNRTINLYTINLHEMASASPICLNFDTINDLAKNDLVTGLLNSNLIKEHLCPSCEQGKSKRRSHPPKPVPNSKQRLHLLHMDLCGPMRITSINGKRVGISHQTSSVRTPQQNGVVERRNRTLVEATRTMLIFSCAPLFLWAKAIARRLYCYPMNDCEDIGKLGAKGDIGFFIGYSVDLCAYRVYNRRTKKIIETMNVTFNELSAMTFEQSSSKPRLQGMTSRQINSGLDITYAHVNNNNSQHN